MAELEQYARERDALRAQNAKVGILKNNKTKSFLAFFTDVLSLKSASRRTNSAGAQVFLKILEVNFIKKFFLISGRLRLQRELEVKIFIEEKYF